jgi:hypothetical protein
MFRYDRRFAPVSESRQGLGNLMMRHETGGENET